MGGLFRIPCFAFRISRLIGVYPHSLAVYENDDCSDSFNFARCSSYPEILLEEWIVGFFPGDGGGGAVAGIGFGLAGEGEEFLLDAR